MAELRTVATDLVLVESPRWHDGRLVFSDWGTGEILALAPDGERRRDIKGAATLHNAALGLVRLEGELDRERPSP